MFDRVTHGPSHGLHLRLSSRFHEGHGQSEVVGHLPKTPWILPTVRCLSCVIDDPWIAGICAGFSYMCISIDTLYIYNVI